MNIDLHCDLLSYFLFPHEGKKEDLGCSIPYLLEGEVGLQVMAIYSATEKGSVAFARKQIAHFKKLLEHPSLYRFEPTASNDLQKGRLGIITSIENASCFCEEDESLDSGFQQLEYLIQETGAPMYIGITHHSENRFGGGNNTTIGLKDDGRSLLEFLNGKRIAIDLAHTSDRLAYDLIDYIDKKGLDIPVIASHSNSRVVYANSRNLPDELAQEVIKRNGLIGLNFIKDYINKEQPQELYTHVEYLLRLGAKDQLCFGADFFFDKAHPDKSRYPFFFEEYQNALAYNTINEEVGSRFGAEQAEKISHKNALAFFKRLHFNQPTQA
ncbi:MAG: dipeptidase [Bacteroidota bacterium]